MSVVAGVLPEPQFFIFLIGVACVSGLVLLARQFLLALDDARNLRVLRSNARQARAGALRTLEDLGPVLSRDLRPGSVAARRVEHLLEQCAASAEAPQFQALAEIEMARAHRGLALPRTIAAILVLLGLCGAVSGLLEAVPGMVDILTSQTSLFEEGLALKGQREALEARRRAGNEAELQQDVEQQYARESDYASRRQRASTGLRSLGTRLIPAFQASLSGILATILLTLVLWGAENIQERQVLTPLEEVTATWLVPLLTPKNDFGSLREVLGILTNSQEYFSELTDRLLGQFDQVSAQLGVLYAVVDQFRHAAGALGADRTALEEAHRSLLESVHRFEKLAEEVHAVSSGQDLRHRQLVDSVQRLVGPLEALGDQLRSDKERDLIVLQGLLTSLRESLDSHLDRMDQVQAQAAGERQQAGEAWQAQAQVRDERLRESLDAVRQAVEGQAASLSGLAPAAEAQTQALDAVRQAVEGQAAALGEMREETVTARQEAQGGIKATEQASQRLGQVEQVLLGSAEILRNLPAAQAEALAPVLARARWETQERPGGLPADAGLLEAVRQLNEATRHLAGAGSAPEAADPRLPALLERLEARLDSLEQAGRVVESGERWSRLALLCLPSCGVAVVGVLYLVMPPIPLAIAAGAAGLLTGGMAWLTRRGPR